MPSRPKTRSQSGEDQPHIEDNSSEGESLNATMINASGVNECSEGNEDTGETLPSTPTQSPQQLTVSDVFSTLNSLKAAIDELRKESCQNNNAIKGLSAKMVESKQQNQNSTHIAAHGRQNLPPLTARNMQHLPPIPRHVQQNSTLQPSPNRAEGTPVFSYTQLPPSPGHVLQPSTNNFQQMPITPGHIMQQPTNSLQQMPSLSGYIPPSANLHDMPPLYNNDVPPPPTSATSNEQYVMPPRPLLNYYSSVPAASQYSEFAAKLYHLPSFDGKPEDWPLFFATYEDTNLEFGYTNRQNLIRLQKALLGVAKDSVKSMLIYPENVPLIIEELKFNFGRPELLIKSQLEKIKVYPAITENRLDNILGLATCTKNIVAFFKSAKCDNHLMNPILLEQLVLKLPLSKQYEWARFAVSVTPFATIEDFSRWITDMARFCSLMPQVVDERRQQPLVKARRVLHSKEQQLVRKDCPQCKGNHELNDCEKFKELEINARWEQVKRARVCFACLRRGHNLMQCKRKNRCVIKGCNRYHHPMLHQDISAIATTNSSEEAAHILQCHQNKDATQLFKILPVTLHGPGGLVTVYALLDEGSSVSLLEEDVAKLLGLKGQKSSITLQWYDNMRKTESSMKVKVEISPKGEHGKKYVINNLHTVKKLDLPIQSFNKADFEYLSQLPIQNYNNEKPSMLIGLDNCLLSLAERVVERGPYLPVASSTKLGWVAYGPVSKCPASIARICHINESHAWKEVHKLVQDYFSVENFGVKATSIILESDDDKRAKYVLENSTRKVGNRYETGLLWRKDDTVLPDSFEMARQRLFKVEGRMRRDPDYAVSYKDEINKYISKGYARLLRPNEVSTRCHERVWYLPHFGVTNPHKPGKLRIVFDAAAAVSNVSLNSTLLKGPEHAKPIQSILCQFRQGKIAVAGDIEEMFSQVLITAADQDSQRFLWRNGDADRKIQVFVMQSMVFGAACSPCCAEYIKNVNAKEHESAMPRGAKAVIDNTYVDDLVISFNCIEEALEVTQEAIHINAAGGFNLRRFSSNSSKVEAVLNGGKECGPDTLKMERQEQTNKILGLYWNKATDCFEFHVRFHKICPDVLNGKRPPTKREVLGIVMAVFDPFGFLANFTTFSKLLVQKTWKLCLQWDDPLPNQLQNQWNAWWQEFGKLRTFAVPRYYSPLLSVADDIQLHIFVDASSSAYAAVAYLRIRSEAEVNVSFVSAKSRCAPPRGMTIPRLELQSAVLGCRLKTFVEENHKFEINRTTLWSDSTTVVSWIRSTEREYKQFVACRIAEILTTTEAGQWRWLATDLNVADEATRATLPRNFDFGSRWLSGPDFLKTDESCWPADTPCTEVNQGHEEEKSNTVLVCKSVKTRLFDVGRFSKFLRLKRSAAWVLRFINIKTKKFKLTSTELTASELEAGEKLICRLVQVEMFGVERECLVKGGKLTKGSSIYQLTPYIDSEMLLRVNGRIDNAYFLPETARNPIIMPTKHLVTTMIVAYYHQNGHHQNDHIVINEVRQKYWVPHIRSVLKAVKRSCPVCIRNSAKPTPPLMGQLPVDRIMPFVRPFSYVGLDYCGPFNVAMGRRREKRWIALFTCLTTRALHLEIAVDLSTDAFLICLRNFVNRRGVPVRIRSDNGTNFVGAQKEITAENRFFDHEMIQRELSKSNIDWVFNCPSNPHAGGCWERLVRCVKQLLCRIFKEEAPRLETFRSAVIEAESIINDRPLTELPIDANSEEPLTPNHFVLGSLNSTQTPGHGEENVCLRKQWRIAQNLKDRLWKRWLIEYLPQLLKRPKWREKSETLRVDDMVLVLDSNQPRSQWKLGRITRVFMGKDGQARSAEVKTPNGHIRRPAVKLAVMRLNESF